jgi:hypothetical protein
MYLQQKFKQHYINLSKISKDFERFVIFKCSLNKVITEKVNDYVESNKRNIIKESLFS